MASPVPPLGLGTSQNEDPETCAETIRQALEIGYRHIDTAQMYLNEEYVGEGLAAADVPREEVFLATKVTETNLAPEDVARTARESLDRLGVDYVDLLYVHFPIDAYDPEASLPAFEQLQDEGLTRHIGVSNFTRSHLEEALAVLEAPIVANQVEVHPMLRPNSEMVELCREQDIDIVAYSPFCRGAAFDLEAVETVADRNDISKAQAILAWILSKGYKPIPKAVGVDHLRNNLGALDVELSPKDIALIDSVEERRRKFDREAMDWERPGQSI